MSWQHISVTFDPKSSEKYRRTSFVKSTPLHLSQEEAVERVVPSFNDLVTVHFGRYAEWPVWVFTTSNIRRRPGYWCVRWIQMISGIGPVNVKDPCHSLVLAILSVGSVLSVLFRLFRCLVYFDSLVCCCYCVFTNVDCLGRFDCLDLICWTNAPVLGNYGF